MQGNTFVDVKHVKRFVEPSFESKCRCMNFLAWSLNESHKRVRSHEGEMQYERGYLEISVKVRSS